MQFKYLAKKVFFGNLISDHEYNPDIIAVCETWLKPDVFQMNFCLQDIIFLGRTGLMATK